ncbi:HlyD family type I secretion periplasmic adaptor subunit [uncultured Roseobacter sp.]|uniref:HlyD family type I secretion periplasmic adaptor subunit n=1 Tax=uncultured Roseobacter sp. TaxID=114847 RepID=UPI0026132A6B|nr:HlyD family type I secretion periplasmic adaptor subunit [uncultured Roseobacter sp.]
MRDRFGYRRTADLAQHQGRPKEKVDRRALDFQPDAVEVELRRVPAAARVALYAILLIIATAIVWAWWAKIDRTVTARGKLVSQSRTIVKQPYRPSVIRTLDVRAGDVVQEGDIIASLDPTLTEADQGQLLAKAALLSAELSRLDAESAGADFAPQAGERDAVIQQVALFQRRELEKAAALEGFEARLKTLESQAAVAAAQEAQIVASLALADSKLQTAIRLVQRNAGSMITQQEAETEVEKLKAQRREKIEEAEGYRRQQRVVENERLQYLSSRATQVEDRRLEVKNELEQLRFEIQKANRVAEFDAFYAETDGVIMDVTQKSVGSIVETAEVLFTLVPTDEGLDIELELSAEDIGWVHLGQAVRAKLDPFPFQRHGTMQGELISISPDAFQREINGRTEVYYRVRVAITDNRLRNLPEGFRLVPGITTTAEIRIGERTVLSYLTDPFHRALDESLKEPN